MGGLWTFPAARRSSLSRVKIPAAVGVAHEVPSAESQSIRAAVVVESRHSHGHCPIHRCSTDGDEGTADADFEAECGRSDVRIGLWA